MKKRSFCAAALCSAFLMLTSCEGFDINDFLNPDGGDDEEEVVPGKPDDNININPGTSMDPDEQKVKLEEVGLKLMKKMPAEDMQNFVDFYEALLTNYFENEKYDLSELGTFVESAVDSSYNETITDKFIEAENKFIHDNIFNVMVVLSNHKGEFLFGKEAVTKVADSDYDGVKITIPLNGKTYVAQLTTSGKSTRAIYDYISYHQEKESYGYMDPETGEWIYLDAPITQIYKDNTRLTIDVPEVIDIRLLEDGQDMAYITVETSMDLSATGIVPSTDSFNADVKVAFNNGYEIIAERVAYDGAKGQALSTVRFGKDGEALLSSAAAGDVRLQNSVYEYDYGDFSGHYTNIIVDYAKNLNLLFDILGEVQISGTCSNAEDFFTSFDAYFEALRYWDDQSGYSKIPDEEEAKRHLANMNAKIDLSVYYDGAPTRQAKVELMMSKKFCDWDVNGDYIVDNRDINYDLMFCVRFEDNSSYSLSEYFTEDAFKTLIDTFGSFSEGYSDLFAVFGEFFAPEVPMDDWGTPAGSKVYR